MILVGVHIPPALGDIHVHVIC